jgi:hypothetical protein
MHRVKLLLMGLFAVLAVGSVASATASAEAGPFWLHRFSAEEAGKKFSQSEQEKYYGQGKTLLIGTVSGRQVILAGELQIKGTLWNEANQGQLKLQAEFHHVIWLGHSGCTVTVTVPEDYQGHLMWKWNGEKKQLEEAKQEKQHWDGIIVPGKTTLGATGLSGKNVFAKVLFTGAGCEILNGIAASASGAAGFTAEIGLGVFRKTFTFISPGVPLVQHFWNGSSFVGLKENLIFGENEASFIAYIPVEASQEVAVTEK